MSKSRIKQIIRKTLLRVIALLKEQGEPKYLIGNMTHHSSNVDSLIPQFIKIGNNFISAPNSIILAHDASYFLMSGRYRVEPVEIGDDVFLGAGAIVLPGVKIGNRVVIGAGSIVTNNVPDNCVVAGNPSKVICTIDEYLEKAAKRDVLYSAPYTIEDLVRNKGKVTDEQCNEFQKAAITEYERRYPNANTWIKYGSKNANIANINMV